MFAEPTPSWHAFWSAIRASMLLPLTTLTHKHNAPLLRHCIATTGLAAISSPAVEAGSATEIQMDDRLSNKAV